MPPARIIVAPGQQTGELELGATQYYDVRGVGHLFLVIGIFTIGFYARFDF